MANPEPLAAPEHLEIGPEDPAVSIVPRPPQSRAEALAIAALRGAFRRLGPWFPEAMGALAYRLFTRPRRHDPPAFEREIALQAEPLTVRAGGLDLHAQSWGAGPVVLLVHGWEGRGAQLARFMGPLAGSGYRVVALDGPAHGQSPGRAVMLPEMAEALLAAGRQLGPLHGVIAHSFGGSATVVALAQGLRARRVVVVGSSDALGSVVARFRALLGIGPETMAVFLRRIEAHLGMPLAACDVTSYAAGLRVPALIVHDRGDAEVPFAEGARLHAHWPGAQLMATEGLGHRRILKAQGVIHAAHEFLTQP